MSKLFILVVAAVCFTAALALRDAKVGLEVEFGKFMALYNRSYTKGSNEYARRFQNYVRNAKRINEMNSKSRHAVFGVNEFSDWSLSEFNKLTPQAHDSALLARSCLAKGVSFDLLSPAEKLSLWPSATNAPPPASFDWRTKGKVTPIKNQGQCGSCWTFSTTGAIESAWAIAGHPLIELSEQEIVDCSTACVNEPPYGDVCNQGCNGGWPWSALTDIMSWNGLATEAQYPYTAETDSCVRNAAMNNAPVKNYTCLSGTGQKNDGIASEVAMQNYIANYGPLSIALDATPLMSYTSGIVTNADGCSQTQLDHAVLIVGYGVQNNVPYWIVKNSWGTSWGLNGYFWIERGANTCGLASGVSAPVVK